ncbi:Zinc finger, CCHC-type [Penicillium digitatum]|uniref:Zinc finger, CCHC-type n=1 Tax=Penicillium digitatum TaxID=36651 RepID=A0A7T7BM67_PENDI|nr:Zinc finger, CCHC-type [Penicillium digitatum]
MVPPLKHQTFQSSSLPTPWVRNKDEEESVEQEIVAALDPNTPTPEPQRPVDAGEDDSNGEGSSIRERRQKTPTRERFHELAREYQNLKRKVQELEDEVTVLHSDKIETEIVIELLTQERDEAIAHRDIAIRERGDLAFRLVNPQNQSSSSTPMVDAITNRKTTKMPDAPMFSDGKKVRFETWETVIRQKLEANADHYPLPLAEEAAVIEENRKRDLYSKLPYLLQSQVMWAVNQD